MGLFAVLASLFRRRAKSGPSDARSFLSSLLSTNASAAMGRSVSVPVEETGPDSLGADLASESRILAVKLRVGGIEPLAQLFFSRPAASHLSSLPIGDAIVGGDDLDRELAAARVLASGLAEAASRAVGALGSGEGPEIPAHYGFSIAVAGDLPYLRWSILDCRVFLCEIEGERLYVAIRREAADRLDATLSGRGPSFAMDLLGPKTARPGAGPAPGDADEEFAIDSPLSFPLARALSERRFRIPGGEARTRPESLLICSTSRKLSLRAQTGYRIGLAASGPTGGCTAILRILASPLGPYESGSQEWRALLGALAARSAVSIGALLGMDVRASSAGPATPEEALADGQVVAISYNVSFGGARGRVILVFDRAFMGLMSRRLFAGGQPDRLGLASRSPALAVEAINAFLGARSFPSYMRALREVPPVAQTVAARLPLGGRPLYAIMEELGERDLALVIGKLVQKGFMLMEHRYAIFFHELHGGESASPAIVTPCDDYESLFSRFPARWDQSDRARSRLRAAFGDLNGLIEAHYDAAWTLYREHLADRLPLTPRGEVILRASGEAFADRLRAAVAEQSPAIEAAVAAAVQTRFTSGKAGAEAARSIAWSDKARELCHCPPALSALLPVIGARAASSLRDAIARIESRLADGREDAYALWKDRRVFLDELAAGPDRARRGGIR